MSDIVSCSGEGLCSSCSSDLEESQDSDVPSDGSIPSITGSQQNPTLHFIFEQGFFTVEGFRINIGESTRHIPRKLLLNSLWTNDLDTPCMVCEKDFDDAQGPPIRTFSIDKEDVPDAENLMLALSLLTVHVHNRHLGCAINLDVKFITVSHVWHNEVRTAHLSKRPTDEAVALTWFVPIFILNNLASALESQYDKVELWHDYLSVPQWNYTVQQRLLLYLPRLYQASPLCLFHLDDVSNSILKTAFDETATSYERTESISKFFSSHWFRRLWVALEYISCTRACLMVERNRFIGFENSFDDSFTNIIQYFSALDRIIRVKEGPTFTREMMDKYQPRAAEIAEMRIVASKVRSLGEAYNIVSRLQCHNPRDRFLAIIGLLGLGDYTENAMQIPKGITAACHWVAMKCLERGDFTPLLLVPGRETDVPYARWLRGHERMHRLMWTGGIVTNSISTNLNIIHNGRVEPELEYVGTIEDYFYIGFGIRWSTSAFEFVITALLDPENQNQIFSAVNFVDTLLRIYAVPPYISERYPQIPNSFEQYCAANPDFESEIVAIILIYKKMIPRTGPADRLPMCEILATKLFFDRVYIKNLNCYTRLEYSNSHADAKFYLDCLARVRCPGCNRPFVHRLAFYNAYRLGRVELGRLYRFPGLSCIGFPGNGICLIMAGTLIRGRTMFGTPACACSIKERIFIN